MHRPKIARQTKMVEIDPVRGDGEQRTERVGFIGSLEGPKHREPTRLARVA